ncbi:MAG: hypothetical protein WDO71_24375 [Bacteroidota bacterium]
MAIKDSLMDLLVAPILLPGGTIRSRCISNPEKTITAAAATSGSSNTTGDKDPCKCECDNSCQHPSKHCICIKTYVADLFIVKEELARYEEGDIADIENILAGELKERRLRNLYRNESSNRNRK